MARGKGKKGINRGSGKRFSAQSAEEIESRNARLEEFNAERARRRADADDDDADDNDKDAERKAMEEIGMRLKGVNTSKGDNEEDGVGNDRKNKGLEGIISVENPNWAKSPEVAEGGMSRKEREQAEKAAAAAAYRRKHEAGLTDEYKRDMAKLAEVRKRREEAEARNKAEKAEAEALEAERKKQAEAVGAINDDEKKSKKKSSKSNSIPKLDKIKIKKMKPAQLKEQLKIRGLDIQGNAKQLTQRLLDYEESR